MSSNEENFKLFCELRGQEVEAKFVTGWGKGTLSDWYDNQVYCFGFQETDIITDEIRPIKNPKYEPWTAETIPFPLAVREKRNKGLSFISLYSAGKNEVVLGEYYLDSGAKHMPVSYQELLDDWETRDGGVCGGLKDD
jgi:hypothetical protein